MRVFTLGEDKSVPRREKSCGGDIFSGKRGCRFVCFPFVEKYGEPTSSSREKVIDTVPLGETAGLYQKWQILWVKLRCSYMDRLENTTCVLQKIENRGKSSSGEISFTQGGNWGQLWGQFLLARTEFFFSLRVKAKESFLLERSGFFTPRKAGDSIGSRNVLCAWK